MILKGLDAAIAELNKRAAQVKKATPKAMNDIVLDGMAKAMEKTPVLTGDLRGSTLAKVNGSKVASGNKDGSITSIGHSLETDKAVGTIGYYGLPYTVRQHEDLSLQHPNGEAKFLENAVNENTDAWIKHLADSTKKAVE